MGGTVPSSRRSALARSGALALRADYGATTITIRVAIATPIGLQQLADLPDQPAAVPAGQGGTPPLPEVRALIARGHNVSFVPLDPELTNGVAEVHWALPVRVVSHRDTFRVE